MRFSLISRHNNSVHSVKVKFIAGGQIAFAFAGKEYTCATTAETAGVAVGDWIDVQVWTNNGRLTSFKTLGMTPKQFIPAE